MSSLPSTALDAGLAEAIQRTLKDATGPLKYADLAKPLKKLKPKKVKASDFDEEIKRVFNEELRLGKLFAYSSGKKGIERYWAKDEKQVLREKALELTAEPLSFKQLTKELTDEVNGTDPAFVQDLLREMLFEERLYEYPAKTKKDGPSVANCPPAPLAPLEQPQYQKDLDKLIKACQALMDKAAVNLDEVIAVLRSRIAPPAAIEAKNSDPIHEVKKPALPEKAAAASAPTSSEPMSIPEELHHHILRAVEGALIRSLRDVRKEMPSHFQGQIFDEAVLQLADQNRIGINADADPGRFSEAERNEYVCDGRTVFTKIMKG